MTLPDERARVLIWFGGFLIELAWDESLPLHERRSGVVIARHFPTIETVATMSVFRHSSGFGIGLAAPNEVGWSDGCPLGPLRHSTRLEWPADPSIGTDESSTP